MSVFTKVPAIDWLKELAKGIEKLAALDVREPMVSDYIEDVDAKKLMILYKYLLWSFRYQRSDPQSDEHKVALGLLTKYHRKLYDIPPSPFERTKLIPEAEALRKKMIADAKKAKHGKA